MTHEKNQLELWIAKRYANDYYKSEQCNSEINILEFKIHDKSVEVLYQFWSNQALIDSNSFLFDSEISKEYDCYLPSCLIRCTFKDMCIWKTKEDFEELAVSNDLVSVESEFISSDYFEWDDPQLAEDVVADFVANCYPEAMLEMFQKEYDVIAKDIPNRLQPYMKKYIPNKN
jgi:hypothetical protein